MPSLTMHRLLIIGVLAATGLSCNKKDTGETALECKGPASNAGPDQGVLLGASVTLDGHGSEVCSGQKSLYTWSFNTLPVDSALTDSALSDNSSETAVSTSFTPDVIGTYVLSLVVTDELSTSAVDLVVVDVTTSNLPPVADCGDPLAAVVDQRVVLDGTGSYDPEGSPLEYAWTLTSVPDTSSLGATDIYNPGGPTPTVIPDVPGIFVAGLVVGDGMQWSEPVYCTITVTSDNQIPIADAGEGGTLPPCTPSALVLDGFGSWDPEGQALSYLWSLVEPPPFSTTSDKSFVDPTVPNAVFNWDVAGTYTFQLVVSDGDQWSVPDVVSYTIADGSSNNYPIANAGDDQTISGSAACSSSAYTWTCEDCPAMTVALDGSASYDLDGDPMTYYWSEETGTVNLLTPYSVFTDAVTPAVATTYRTTVTTSWTINLDVSDCGGTSSDSLVLTYNCTGTR